MTTPRTVEGWAQPSAPGPTSAPRWQSQPAAHDFAAAASYLALVLGKKDVIAAVAKLERADTVVFKAKDILRSSGLPLLPATNPDVKKELERIAAGQALSPCLLIRGRLRRGRPAQIVDGYHRVCASNWVDEDSDIPIRIVGL